MSAKHDIFTTLLVPSLESRDLIGHRNILVKVGLIRQLCIVCLCSGVSMVTVSMATVSMATHQEERSWHSKRLLVKVGKREET